MKNDRLLTCTFLGAAALVGCGSNPEPEATESSSSALSLPSDPNWAQGLSPDAVRLGTDTNGAALYACRATIGNSVTPGKTRADWNACDVSYGGGEYSIASYQTLIPEWSATSRGQIPSNATALGTDTNGAPFYVCRAVNPSGSLQVGKIRAGFTGCSYGYGGVEVNAMAYQVLSNPGAFALSLASLPAGARAFPTDAIQAGTDNNGAPIYACAVSYDGSLQLGKTEPGWGACDISWSGGEVSVTNTPYQVVVAGLTPAPLNAATHPFIGGTDDNGSPLGLCSASYAGATQVGKYWSSGGCLFGYGGKEVLVSSGYDVFANYVDANPIVFDFAQITFPSGVADGGNASVTLKPDGSYVFAGRFHDSGSLDYTESTIFVVKAADGTAFTFSRSGKSYGGCCDPDDTWNIAGTNAAIAAAWPNLKKAGVFAQQTSSVSLDIADMWSSLKADIGYVSDVVAVVGVFL